MPLTLEQAGRSLERIIVQLPMGAGQSIAYIKAIWEACEHFDPKEFDQVCIEIASNIGDGKPQAGRFKDCRWNLRQRLAIGERHRAAYPYDDATHARISDMLHKACNNAMRVKNGD